MFSTGCEAPLFQYRAVYMHAHACWLHVTDCQLQVAGFGDLLMWKQCATFPGDLAKPRTPTDHLRCHRSSAKTTVAAAC